MTDYTRTSKKWRENGINVYVAPSTERLGVKVFECAFSSLLLNI